MALARNILMCGVLVCAPDLCMAADAVDIDGHVRSSDPRLVETIAQGRATSPTLRRIADEIEASDVVVYVVYERQPATHVAAHVAFMSAAGGRRYVHVGIDRRLCGTMLIGILAHELEHAAEIARNPSVVDVGSFRKLYARIGFVEPSGGTAERFDTDAALQTGRRAMRETRDARKTKGQPTQTVEAPPGHP